MRLEYDDQADALDISLSDAPVVRTVEIDSGTLVDVGDDGRIVSIEVIRPDRNWPLRTILHDYEVGPAEAEMMRALWPLAAGDGYGAVYRAGVSVAAPAAV